MKTKSLLKTRTSLILKFVIKNIQTQSKITEFRKSPSSARIVRNSIIPMRTFLALKAVKNVSSSNVVDAYLKIDKNWRTPR